MKLSERIIEALMHQSGFSAESILSEIQALEEKAAKYDELAPILGTANEQTILKAKNWDLLERLPPHADFSHYRHGKWAVIYSEPGCSGDYYFGATPAEVLRKYHESTTLSA